MRAHDYLAGGPFRPDARWPNDPQDAPDIPDHELDEAEDALAEARELGREMSESEEAAAEDSYTGRWADDD